MTTTYATLAALTGTRNGTVLVADGVAPPARCGRYLTADEYRVRAADSRAGASRSSPKTASTWSSSTSTLTRSGSSTPSA